MADPLKDPRFAHLTWDPKFNRVPKRERKVQIDDRFKSMFTESKFQSKVKVDKRGRPVKRTTTEDLKRFYDLATSDESEDEEKQDESEKETKKNSNVIKSDLKSDSERSTVSDSSESDEESDAEEINLDLARGEGNLFSSSSENDSEDEWKFEENNEIPEHKWGELDADASKTDQATRRFAVCNMDWDRIKAKDLLVLFNSFKPQLGMVKSCSIYPSEYGLQRMKEEEIDGPKELIKKRRSSNDDDSESDSDSIKNDQNDDEKITHREKIRQYQLNRLKYYYAVVECDSVETANSIYGACDGVEYESSAAKLDLRFIPDEMTFEHAEPKDEAKDLGDLSSYKPTLFRNAALQQSKVELTWEETDVHRRELVKRAFDEDALDSMHFGDILAPCSSDEEAEEINKNVDDKTSEFVSNEPVKHEKKKKKSKKLQWKGKQKDNDEDFSLNVQDPRFSAVYTSHLYNIDPSDPSYKKSKHMDALVQEKLSRIPKTIPRDDDHVPNRVPVKENNIEKPKLKDSADLSLLIKSVKSKTDVWQRSKKMRKK